MKAEIKATSSPKLEAIELLIAKIKNKQKLDVMEEFAVVAMSLAGLGQSVGENYNNPQGIQDAVNKWMNDDSVTELQKGIYKDILNITGRKITMPDIDWSEVQAQSEERSRRNKKNTRTYFVLNPLTKLIKIGKSRDFSSRIRTLSTSAGANLHTLLIIDRDVENKLHTRFAHVRQKGEWFKDVDGCITSFIERYKNGEFGFDGDGA